jgi:Plasmid pRiA4b ORF-3-like protein
VHHVIQAAMGWLDYRSWEFEANKQKYAMLLRNERDWNERIKNAAAAKLSSLLAKGVREMGYIYDMGDHWRHRITVEALKAAGTGA